MFRIPCPQCGKSLKVKDAGNIGRKAMCPRCQHRFVLTVPEPDSAEDEVELQLAEPPVTQRAAPPAQPMVGTSARWVPDAAESPEPLPAAPGAAEIPASPAVAPMVVVPSDEVTSPVSEIRKRNRKRGKAGLVVSVVGVLLTAGVGAAAWFMNPGADSDSKKDEVVANEAWEAEKEELRQSAAAADAVSPTDGKQIDLRYLPPGGNIIVHLHPAEIWSEQDSRKEVLFALGEPLRKWLEARIREISTFEPAEIDQLTISIGLGPRESEPEIAAVVRLRERQQRSVMIRQRFQGQRNPQFTEDIYVGEKWSYLLIDEKTFAVAPALLADELVASMQFAADPSDDLRLLIEQTDSDRHVTVMLDTSALEIHTPALFAEGVQPAIVQFTDWLGKDVDAVVLSTHLGERMFLQTLLRSGTGSTAARLNRHIRNRLAELPQDILGMVRYMQPGRKGARTIIGRFPAMAQAVSLATETGIGDRFVQLTTVLPERALPNLVVGTVLTWDESTRTDFTAEQAPVSTEPARKLPDTLAERLKLEIEIEFNRTPLQEAFAMLGEDAGIRFQIDGDGLKLAGYTQNMPQNFNLGKATVVAGVKEILKQYDQMVLVADEAAKVITVTTRDMVRDRGQTIYEPE